jgi:hypothetical protein
VIAVVGGQHFCGRCLVGDRRIALGSGHVGSRRMDGGNDALQRNSDDAMDFASHLETGAVQKSTQHNTYYTG